MNNPPDFTIDDINVIDAPDAIQIRDENGQTRNVDRQTAYNTIVNNPRIEKLSYHRNPDNFRIALYPVLGSDVRDYINYGLNINIYNINMDNYYVVALYISPNAPLFMTLYHLPIAPAVPAVAPAVPPAAIVGDTPEYQAALADRIRCPVCMEHEKNTRLNPCGHLLCADDAAIIKAGDSPICPMCRKPIESTSGIFYGGYYNKYLKYQSKLK